MKTEMSEIAVMDRAVGRCERMFRHGKLTGNGVFRCSRKAAVVHTVSNHGTAGEDELIALCNYCANWIKNYPDEARKQGLIK